MASSRPWPFDDDEDRPSGSVRPLSQADLQAILAHLGDDPDELLAGTGADRPVVAVRVRASVGRPGGSAQARWRQERAAAWLAWTRTLPWRVAATLCVGAAGGVLASLLAPRLSLVLGTLAAVAAGWVLRFRPSPDAVAWRRGAAGERRTARLLHPLERHGWVVLHDLAVPGSRANIDHLVIGPGGVFVIDSKHYRGRLQLDGSGRLWHGRFPLAPMLRAVDFEADRAAQVLADPDVVVPIVAVHGAQVPWGKVVMNGVPVVAARRLPSMLRVLPAVLGPERVAALADQARIGFHPAALDMSGPTGLGGLRAVCRRRPRLRTPEGRRRAVPDGGHRAFATIDRTMRWQMPTLADVLKARLRIAPHLRPTPLLGYPTLNELREAEVFIKHENYQPVGAFKVRGGVNLLSQLSAEERERGVIAASTGNHGQSLAYAAHLFAVPATICAPENANPVKVASMRGLGAKLVFRGRDFDEAREHCEQLANEHGYRYVHSGNEPLLIAGVATETLEILQEQPEMEVIVVPVGGGSGAAGACIVAKAVNPAIRVIGVQSEAAPTAYRSWRERRLVEDRMETFAEGLATRTAFELPQRILWQWLDDFVLVSDDDIRAAQVLMIEATRNLIEAAGAAPLAAALRLREQLAAKRIALIASGGNASRDQILDLLK